MRGEEDSAVNVINSMAHGAHHLSGINIPKIYSWPVYTFMRRKAIIKYLVNGNI